MGLGFQMVAFPDPIPILPSLGRSIETMQSLMGKKRLTGKKATAGEILVVLGVGQSNFSFQFETPVSHGSGLGLSMDSRPSA